jgi:hypothetical protein
VLLLIPLLIVTAIFRLTARKPKSRISPSDRENSN